MSVLVFWGSHSRLASDSHQRSQGHGCDSWLEEIQQREERYRDMEIRFLACQEKEHLSTHHAQVLVIWEKIREVDSDRGRAKRERTCRLDV